MAESIQVLKAGRSFAGTLRFSCLLLPTTLFGVGLVEDRVEDGLARESRGERAVVEFSDELEFADADGAIEEHGMSFGSGCYGRRAKR